MQLLLLSMLSLQHCMLLLQQHLLLQQLLLLQGCRTEEKLTITEAEPHPPGYSCSNNAAHAVPHTPNIYMLNLDDDGKLRHYQPLHLQQGHLIYTPYAIPCL